MKLHRLQDFPDVKDGTCVAMDCFDGRKVRVATWPATTSSPKGTICLLQGRSEFIEKYYEVIAELRQRGFAVATFDWRGQGGSDRMLSNPLKGHVNRFDDYGRDLQAFVKRHVLPDCPPPYFALAHSMGGLILLHNLPQLRTIFDRAILSAPLIELAGQSRRLFGVTLHHSTIRKSSKVMCFLGRGKAYVPGASRSSIDRKGFEKNPLTSDFLRYDRMRSFLRDFPELGIAGPTNRWTHECLKAIQTLKDSDFTTTIHTPTLIVTASSDQIVSSNAAEQFAAALRAGHATSIPTAQHEIMMERNMLRQQFWAAFDAFIPGAVPLLRTD